MVSSPESEKEVCERCGGSGIDPELGQTYEPDPKPCEHCCGSGLKWNSWNDSDFADY